MLRNTLLAGVALVVAGWVSSASASVISYKITDNGVNAGTGTDAGTGIVNVNTSSANFSAIQFTANGNPVPSLNSTSFDVKGNGSAGTLIISITETGLTSFTGTITNTDTINTLAAGNQFTSFTVQNYLDSTNTAYGMQTALLSNTTTTRTSIQGGPLTVNANFTSPFSETTVYTIAFRNGSSGTVSGSSQIVGTAAAVPEPASLAILGVGLATVGMVRRNRRKN